MRVTKEKAAENRDALLQAASRLFRERGIDGVGVADIAREAGLTHGALYAHFSSKDALAAEAFAHGFAGSMEGMRAWESDQDRSFEDYVAVLLSTGMRDRLATGCPMAASASEAGRQGRDVSAGFARAFAEMAAMIEGSLEPERPAALRRTLAIAATAAQIGAIAVARAVEKADPALSEEVLRCVRETLAAASRSSDGQPASDVGKIAAAMTRGSSAGRGRRRKA